LRSWPFDKVGMKATALVLPVPEELTLLSNLICLRYYGTLPQWRQTAGLGDLRPKVFDGIRIDYTPDRTFKYRSKRCEIGLDAS
jgi:hypothetical protein